jgi:hypothetical protein
MAGREVPRIEIRGSRGERGESRRSCWTELADRLLQQRVKARLFSEAVATSVM